MRWIQTTKVPYHDGQGRIVGVLGIFEDITERMLAAEALKKALSDARQGERETRALLEASQAALECDGFNDAAHRVLDACRSVTGAVRGGVGLLKADGTESEVPLPQTGGFPWAVGEGLRAKSYATGRVVYENDLKQGGRAGAGSADQVAPQNVMFVPLIAHGVVAGVMGLANKPGGFTEHDAEMASALGDMAAVALQRIRAEEDLREAETRYRTIFEGAAEGIVVAEVETRRLAYVNEAAGRMFGYSEGEMVGMRVDGIHPADSLPDVIAGFEAQARGEVRVLPEVPCMRSDGSVFYVDIATSLEDIDGRECMVGFFTDVTDGKMAGEALQESEARLSHALDMAGAGHWEYDVDRDTFTFNDNFYRLFRTTAAEQGGYEMSSADYARKFCHPDDAALVGEGVRDALEVTDPHYSRELDHRFLYADGEVGYMAVRAFIAKDLQGRTVKIYGVNQDITLRKRREERDRLARDVLEMLTRPEATATTARDILGLIRERLDFEAVGIRLRDGDDYPYYETNGFAEQFVELERRLCAFGPEGDVVRDYDGNPVLECMCGNVILGRTDPGLPFFTEGGSFWTNSTSDLLASTSEEERQARTRNRCNGEGYESVALIPLRSGRQTIGLLQLNDRRRGKLTLDLVEFLEGLGATVGIAIAREEAHEELEAAARFLSENPSPVLRIGADGALLYVNERGAELLPDWHLQPGRAVPSALRDAAVRALGEGTARVVNLEHGERLYSFHVAPIAGAGYANLYGRDITELMEAEKALRRSEGKFRAMVENIGIGVALISPDLRVLELNRQIEEWFEAFNGDDCPVCYARPDSPAREDRCEQCPTWETLQDGEVHEALLRAGSGAYRVVSSPVRDVRGEVTAAIEMVEDMTERLSMEEQLRQAQKMEAVGQLAGGVAHDFNNLLTGIGGFVSFARNSVEIGSRPYDDLGKATTLVDRAAALTRQLLAFSRHQMLEPVVLDVNVLLTDHVKLLRRLLGEDIDTQFSPAPDLLNVCADPGQMEQMVLNLAVNARDAMPGGGRLIIETANVDLTEDYAREHAEAVPRPPRDARAERHRLRHGRRDPGADLRALLHDQGARQGDGARPCHGLRHRETAQRQHPGLQRAGEGHDVQGLPAGRRRPGAGA